MTKKKMRAKASHVKIRHYVKVISLKKMDSHVNAKASILEHCVKLNIIACASLVKIKVNVGKIGPILNAFVHLAIMEQPANTLIDASINYVQANPLAFQTKMILCVNARLARVERHVQII